jgi:hypothetical protein
LILREHLPREQGERQRKHQRELTIHRHSPFGLGRAGTALYCR